MNSKTHYILHLSSSFYRFFFPFSLAGFLALLYACTATKEGGGGSSLISKAYHDVNAKYNSYFLAREAVKEVEKELFDKRKENYNRVLDVLVATDTNTFKSYDTKMEDCIKKCANIPNRHEESKWLDPGYILIGKARFYRREFEDAINTFKYVNTKGTDPASRNRALIELMRTYMQLEDMRSARAAMLVLRKRPMEKEEQRDYLLMRAHYYRLEGNMIEMAKSLGSAVKIMSKGEDKARAHFILGQVYQQLGRDALAFKNYKAVQKNNPSYELSFYANVSMAQVSKISGEGDVKKVYRYYKKLLRDDKNVEYQDKIYYELGLFELKRGNTKKAIVELNQSIIVSTDNPIQKAYSYLKLGEIHYAELQQYELAKAYYDSVMTSLPKNVENYKDIERRRNTLTEFVEQLTIYRTEDSLQRLVKIPEPQRGDYIASMLKLEENKNQDALDSLTQIQQTRDKLKRQKQTVANNTIAQSTAGQDGPVWYFYNPRAIELGREAFDNRWRKTPRPLVDNWRRSEAIRGIIDTVDVRPSEPTVDVSKMREDAILKRVEARKKAIYDALPDNEEKITASNKKIENSAFELGKIYKFKLEEPKNAVKYLETLLDRFPKTQYEPEARYYLYQLHEELGNLPASDKNKNILLQEFPKSSFARRIVNPNWYKEIQENEAEVKAVYKQAYESYEIGEYEKAMSQLVEIRQKFPENTIEDRLILLEHLIQLKLDGDKAAFKNKLNDFIKNYPDSELLDFAQALLDKVQ
ncbi:MAG: tetratricopeptide repeat protein [Microscillaceae bacterium]|nr:tetratricopeptide repeat protein [Microscillaceae bacterium]